ncbi:MAG: polymerase subunit sigma-70 [Bacteroidetes bacterium]|nr:polymerase subunit sigma-70 [Bacteroidota bacterium]
MLRMYATELHTLDDLQLVARYKQTGDNNCVGVLFQRYTHLVFGVCMKYLKDEDDSKDASMQLFEKLLTDLKKHEIQQFKAWLHMVCKNFCLMQLRSGSAKLKHNKAMQQDLGALMETDLNAHLVHENTKEIQLTHMEECMKGLNEEQRLCVELFYLQEKSYSEITETTSFSMNNVKSYIQNGKRNLKICIESRSSVLQQK